MRDWLVQAGGRLSRRLHARGLLGPTASGVVRRVSARVASTGTYSYRDAYGHLMEAALDDYSERAGFFGALSPALIRATAALLRPGDWAIDAGANVGLVSSALAAAVGRQGRVWSIEPVPRNVERLRALKAANRLEQLEVFPVALAAETSIARLRLSAAPGGSGWGSFVSPWAGDEFLEVPTRPLDELVNGHGQGRPLALIKADLEGFEMEMLKGARETLTTHRPFVVCEFHDLLLQAAGSSSRELLEAFAELGYAPQAPFGRPSGSLGGKVLDMILAPRRYS